MKKIFALIVALCIVLFCGTAFGQNTEKTTNDRKGGFSVGGYDQTRKAKAPTKTRSIVNEEAEKDEKSIEADKSAEDGIKMEAPAPAAEAKEAPAAMPPKEKEKGKQGDTYAHNKGKSGGKDLEQTRSNEAKSKDKPKNVK
jgi:hypothetical protein